MTLLVDIMKQFNIWVLNTSLRLKKILNLAHFITTIFPKVSSALVNTVWTDFIQDWIPKAFIKGYFSSWGFHYSLQFGAASRTVLPWQVSKPAFTHAARAFQSLVVEMT